MPSRDKWAEWRELSKQYKEGVRIQFNDWVYACRDDPALIWQTPMVRYITYGVGGIVAILLLRFAMGLFVPAGAGQIAPRAETAHFDVICTDSACGKYFKIERRFRFDDFPVKCLFCKQETGQLATRCTSQRCGGRMTPTIENDGATTCRVCGEPIGGG